MQNAAQVGTADVRLQRSFEHLHGLGARAVGEFILELAETWDIPDADIADALAVYRQLDAETVHALGADRFPPLPMQRAA